MYSYLELFRSFQQVRARAGAVDPEDIHHDLRYSLNDLMVRVGNKPQTILLLDHEAAGVLREAQVVLPARHHFQAGFTVQNHSMVSTPLLQITTFIKNKFIKFK